MGSWTPEQNENLLRLRAENIPWAQICKINGEGKSANACQKQYYRLCDKAAEQSWSPQMDLAFEEAYDKKKAEMWHLVAVEIGFKGNWKVLEKKFLARAKGTFK